MLKLSWKITQVRPWAWASLNIGPSMEVGFAYVGHWDEAAGKGAVNAYSMNGGAKYVIACHFTQYIICRQCTGARYVIIHTGTSVFHVINVEDDNDDDTSSIMTEPTS
jgi:hypothetical protein